MSKKYLDSLRSAGNVTILSTSRWLNQALIQTTDQAAINKIRKFSFVKTLKGVGYRGAPATNPRPDKYALENPVTNMPVPLAHRTNGDVLNYGNAYAQVHLHEGEFLHNKGFRGESIQIAVLDAGFRQYKSNTAFDSIRLNKKILGERDFVAFDNNVNEDDLHGANCLSIMAANWPGRLVGTAPQASYWLIRTEDAATEYLIEEHNWVAGAEFADSAGVDMISSSLGYTTFDDATFNHSYTQFFTNTTMVTAGATYAAKKGIIVMNSAGNDGNGSWKYLGFPADADSVCAVGAVNAAGQIASFSSFGYPGKVKPNIVSVGAGTVLAGLNNQPVTGNGTSYSNPNVAGLVACLWQAFPLVNNIDILNVVYQSANRYTTPDERYGYGIPNFKKAYRLLKSKQNFALFGNDWLQATPDPFTDLINAVVVAQNDGLATLELLSSNGVVVATHSFAAEQQEVYQHSFSNLGLLAAGSYTVRYADSVSTRSIAVRKQANSSSNRWLTINEGTMVNKNFTVTLVAPETAPVALRLINSAGIKVAEKQLSIVERQVYSIGFQVPNLPAGAYFLQYISKTQRKVTRLLKR